MDRISSTSSVPNSLKSKWDYINKLDEKVKAGTAAAGALGERIGLSTKYRVQSQAIQHGTKAVLKNRWDANLCKEAFSKYDKLNGLAKTASSGAAAVTYEGLVQHIRAGKAINAFDWKGLLKSRGWHHVDHVTCVTEGSASAIGKAIALNFAKVMIILDAAKDAKTTYQNERKKGTNSVVCCCKAGLTAAKEIGKSLISWEAGALGAAIATVCFPGVGLIGALAGGILVGGTAGYLLERYMPSPVKETVPVKSKSEANPFV